MNQTKGKEVEMFSPLRLSSWLVFTCLLTLTTLAPAQEPRATLVGTVFDPTGAAVPGATVTITNMAMGTQVVVTTNDAGFYQAPYLLPGEYTVSVEAPGFKKAVRERVALRVMDRLELNFTLELGPQVETVTVTAETPALETTTASIGQVIDTRRISELPLHTVTLTS